jgi:hypothetical protein
MMSFLSEIAYSSVKMANSVATHSRKAYKSVQTETDNEEWKIQQRMKNPPSLQFSCTAKIYGTFSRLQAHISHLDILHTMLQKLRNLALKK